MMVLKGVLEGMHGAESFGAHDSMESESKRREKVGRSTKGAAEGRCLFAGTSAQILF